MRLSLGTLKYLRAWFKMMSYRRRLRSSQRSRESKNNMLAFKSKEKSASKSRDIVSNIVER